MSGLALWHFSFHVADLDRSVEFYSGLLGLEVVHRQEQHNPYTARLVGYPDAHLRVAQLRLPDRPTDRASSHDLELVEYVIPRAAAEPIERARPGTPHLAFTVTDIVAEHAHLVDNGVEFVSAPVEITAGVNSGGFCCYFLDPDGITLELVQPRPATDQEESCPSSMLISTSGSSTASITRG